MKKRKKWVYDLKRILNRKPKTIEVVINDTSIMVYPIGTFEKHIKSQYNYGGIGTNPEDNEILFGWSNHGKLIPYSEGQ